MRTKAIKWHLMASAVALALALFSGTLLAQTSYAVLAGEGDTLQNAYFLDRLQDQFDARRQAVTAVAWSKADLLERRNKLRDWFKSRAGELPDRGPLHPQTFRKTDMGAYTIEAVAFESLPGHHVTGLFYLPKTGNAPYPAVLIPCGHSRNGKGSEAYQKAARLFALNGFAVLQADPISQGERFQYLDNEGKPVNGGGTYMHELLGQALLLTGSNALLHELYDNIRSLDFLEQHPAVDKDKLAVAGNSGGGTQVTYLAAFDRRIKVAVPSCYIATTEKKFKTIGSQDGCQQLWGEGEAGIEEQDFLFMAAPVPIRILSAREDFFSIDGAKAAYEELKKLYTVLGVPDRVDHVVGEGSHGWSKVLREAAVQWCKQWLTGDPSPVEEPDDIGFFEDEKMYSVTSTGQVLTAFKNERSVTDLNRERLEKCAAARKRFQQMHAPRERIAIIKELTGFEAPEGPGAFKMTGELEGKGYRVEKLLLSRDKERPGFGLPALLFIPDNLQEPAPAVIVSNEKGKGAGPEPDRQVREALTEGRIVLAVDVCNTGELKDGRKPQYNNAEYWIAKLPLYEGKTLLAYRAEDLLIAFDYLAKHPSVNPSRISLSATGYIGPAALHAALFGGKFERVTVTGAIESWEDVAAAPHSKDQLGNIVPGVLSFYDLPDLAKLMPQGTEVKILAPADPEGKPM